ncbi:MAG: YgfZ/GcvT domain-containing protein [Ilumatobacteraceae bacterium]
MTATAFRITRDVITARGKDARSFLHSQLSNDIAGLAVGSSRYAFALEPTGKIAAFLRVVCVADDHFVLDVDAGWGASALARLNKFKIRVACDFVLETREVLALRSLGSAERTAALARDGAVAAWRENDGAVDVLATSTAADIATDTAAADIFHAERVRCAWPVFGTDIDADSLPAETGLTDVCVSFTKGCYPGQELVERMDSRGSTAPRRLMRLPRRPSSVAAATSPDSAATAATAGVPYQLTDGTVIGQCTSVAGDFALVMVQRAHLGVAEQLARS